MDLFSNGFGGREFAALMSGGVRGLFGDQLGQMRTSAAVDRQRALRHELRGEHADAASAAGLVRQDAYNPDGTVNPQGLGGNYALLGYGQEYGLPLLRDAANYNAAMARQNDQQAHAFELATHQEQLKFQSAQNLAAAERQYAQQAPPSVAHTQAFGETMGSAGNNAALVNLTDQASKLITEFGTEVNGTEAARKMKPIFDEIVQKETVRRFGQRASDDERRQVIEEFGFDKLTNSWFESPMAIFGGGIAATALDKLEFANAQAKSGLERDMAQGRRLSQNNNQLSAEYEAIRQRMDPNMASQFGYTNTPKQKLSEEKGEAVDLTTPKGVYQVRKNKR